MTAAFFFFFLTPLGVVLILSQAGTRVKALEVKVATLIEERDSAKQNVRDAIHAMKAALEELRLKVKDTLITLFAEDSSRQTGLAEVWMKLWASSASIGNLSRLSRS